MKKSDIKHLFGIEIRQQKKKINSLSNDIRIVVYKHVSYMVESLAGLNIDIRYFCRLKKNTVF